MFRRSASPMQCVRGMLIAQLDSCMDAVREGGADDSAIHGVHKELKRTRAGLRLLRKCIGERAYHRENLAIRDAARVLGGPRDAQVLLSAFAALRRSGDSGPWKAFGLRVSRALRGELRDSRQPTGAPAMVAAALQQARSRLASIPAPRLEGIAVSEGLVRVYKSGRKAFAAVRKNPTDACLHEWRKQVKYLHNQLDTVSRMSGGHFASLRKQSSRTADRLGDDHDLAVLAQKIGRIASTEQLAADSKPVQPWMQRIRRARAGLQRKACKSGKRVYSHRPKTLRANVDERV